MKLQSNLTGLLYGVSGAGKSTLLAELAKVQFKEEGTRTLVFMADEGSRIPYELLEDLGVVTVVHPMGNPWIWVNRAFQGLVRLEDRWVPAADHVENLGLIVHEGLTAYAELLMQEMARMSAENINIGGDGLAVMGKDREKEEKNVLRSWKVEVKEGKDVLKIGGNSQSHYGIAQVQIRDGLGVIRPAVPHFYTATLRRGAEEGSKAPVVGPQIVGGALTGSVPRWIDLTFHVETEGNDNHVLYVMPHQDTVSVGRTMALANPRLHKEGASVKVPSVIKPASLVAALRVLESRKDAAREELRKELGL